MNTDFLKALDSVPTSRRDALRTAGRLGAQAAFASIPFLSTAKQAEAGILNYSPEEDIDILNYALTLEYLEYAFYVRGIGNADLMPMPEDAIPAELNPDSVPDEDLPLLREIRDNELAHVGVLSGAILDLDGEPVSFEPSDFTFEVDGANVYDDYALFLTLAQGLEDTGVRAYKGQATSIMSPALLTAALQIHSVEARHAAAIRRLRGNQGWIPFAQPGAPGPIAPVYGPGGEFPSEANTTQGGVELVGALPAYTAEQITEAFDEALDMETVLGIAGQFIN